jgi:hypothetical protein
MRHHWWCSQPVHWLKKIKENNVGKLIVVGVIAFVAGAAAGVAGTGLYIRRKITKAKEEALKQVEEMLKGLETPETPNR